MRVSSLVTGAVCAGAILVLAPAAANAIPQSLCIGHHPQDFVWYTHSCTGHDEPELDPLSNRAGSAQDLTWTIVLPANGAVPVDSVGPTFGSAVRSLTRTASTTRPSSSCSSTPTASPRAAPRAVATT